jgi:hypothetical protein
MKQLKISNHTCSKFPYQHELKKRDEAVKMRYEVTGNGVKLNNEDI